jgi:FtsZ-binding cell division protein ZapB
MSEKTLDPQKSMMELFKMQQQVMALKDENHELKSQLNEQQKGIMARILTLRKEVIAIPKKNPVYKKAGDPKSGIMYMYRSIDDFYNDLQPLLNKHSVGIVPHSVNGIDHETFSNKYGTKQYHEAMNVTYRLFDETGSWIAVTVRISESSQSGRIAQHNMSFGMKACFIQVLQVPVEEMKDKTPDGGRAEQTLPEGVDQEPEPVMDYELFSQVVDAIIDISKKKTRENAVKAFEGLPDSVKKNVLFRKKIGEVMNSKS